jgi:uncharacterized protein with LGFP repeats
MSDPIAELKSLYDFGKEVVGDMRKTLEGLNRSRSVILGVYNATKAKIRITGTNHDHGGFAKNPAAEIGPNSFDVFGSTSSANSIATGTEGSVNYGGDGGFSFNVSWDNPFAGSNSSGAGTSGNDGPFRAFSTTGAGDQNAEMRYSLIQYDFPIIGNIRGKYAEHGWEGSPLGYPIGPEVPAGVPVGRRQNFQGGMISWHPKSGAHIVWGLIGARWLDIGAEQFGYPLNDETATPDGHGRFNHFRAFRPDGTAIGDSSIYFLPETGAHEVFGEIRNKWSSIGWETSPLGYPTDREVPTFDNAGRRQHFQGGMVSWRPQTGAHAVWGLIGARWWELGAEKFGYPITDETTTPDGRGRFNHFRAFRPDNSIAGDSSIYWSPETGAHEIFGAIRDKWASMGWEKSSLGYPTSGELDEAGGRVQHFQHGSLFWTAAGGVVVR